MKKYILCLVLICGSKLFAQQDPQFNLSYTNQMFFNPASMGARHCISASLQGRFQWVGMQNAPMSWSLGLDIPFYFGKTKLNSIGFGILGYGNYAGYLNDGGLRFGLNYRRCKLGPGGLSLGLDLGITTKRFASSIWTNPGGVPDPTLPAPNAAGESFDMGVGIYYSGDNFYVGASCTHLNGGTIPTLHTRFSRQLYVNGGGFVPVGKNNKWRINPNTIVRSDFYTVNFDVGVNVLCFVKENHGILFGANYRFINAVGLNIGYGVKFKSTPGGKNAMFMFGYSFDITTSRLGSAGVTSHEIALRFCFPSKGQKLQRVFF